MGLKRTTSDTANGFDRSDYRKISVAVVPLPMIRRNAYVGINSVAVGVCFAGESYVDA